MSCLKESLLKLKIKNAPSSSLKFHILHDENFIKK